jgi:hypothetical protein
LIREVPVARPAKKSETLEIRIPHDTKAAFMSRCRTDGTSASEAVRSFIEARLAQPHASEPRRRRVWLRSAVGVGAAVGLAATALPSLARPLERADFDQLDSDQSGALAPSEFAGRAGVSVRVHGGGGALTRIGASGFTLNAADPAERELRALVLRAAFTRLDRDRDGAVTFAEYRRR